MVVHFYLVIPDVVNTKKRKPGETHKGGWGLVGRSPLGGQGHLHCSLAFCALWHPWASGSAVPAAPAPGHRVRKSRGLAGCTVAPPSSAFSPLCSPSNCPMSWEPRETGPVSLCPPFPVARSRSIQEWVSAVASWRGTARE